MGFLYSQLFKPLPYPTGSCTGKTIVITGANGGLGKESARHFARLNASTLILAVRNLDAGHACKQELERTWPNINIQVWKLDMSSYSSVEKFAARVNVDLRRVDIFIANAGVATATFRTAEQNELQITVNVISTFLLVGLVLPKLEQTATEFNIRPTLTITTSEVHGHTVFPQKSRPDIFAALNDKAVSEKHWDDQYPISKLLQVFGVRSIAEQRPNSLITINCVNPGLCHSQLGREFNTWGFWLIKLVLARSAEYGSRCLVHAGLQGLETHGQYLSDCEISAPSKVVIEGKETQDRVWKELMRKLEAIKPDITNNF